jgi:hypothetical protein
MQMKLIGSRTGAYEYWVKLKRGGKVWLGQKATSDIDLLLDKNEVRPKANFDVFYGAPTGPYVENNRLSKPKDFDYLMFSLCCKLMRNNLDALMTNYLDVAEVTDLLDKKVGEIYLDYASIPASFCHTLAARAKVMKPMILNSLH